MYPLATWFRCFRCTPIAMHSPHWIRVQYRFRRRFGNLRITHAGHLTAGSFFCFPARSPRVASSSPVEESIKDSASEPGAWSTRTCCNVCHQSEQVHCPVSAGAWPPPSTFFIEESPRGDVAARCWNLLVVVDADDSCISYLSGLIYVGEPF